MCKHTGLVIHNQAHATRVFVKIYRQNTWQTLIPDDDDEWKKTNKRD